MMSDRTIKITLFAIAVFLVYVRFQTGQLS